MSPTEEQGQEEVVREQRRKVNGQVETKTLPFAQQLECRLLQLPRETRTKSTITSSARLGSRLGRDLSGELGGGT